MAEPHRCCQTTVNDLKAAHKRVAAVELQLLLLKAHNDNLTSELADMTLARDNLVRAQTAATIQQMQEDAARQPAVSAPNDSCPHPSTRQSQRWGGGGQRSGR